MNNGRYLTIMDLGRIDFIVRVGLARAFIKNKWQPLIGGTLIHYRFGLRAFEKFELITRVIGWDEKWFYFEQRLVCSRGVAAIALAKGLARDRAGTVTPEAILQKIGKYKATPFDSAPVSQWLAAEQMLHQDEDG